jgi:hypothetical protein
MRDGKHEMDVVRMGQMDRA